MSIHSNDLLSCPFCGSTQLSKISLDYQCFVQCIKCEAHGPWINNDEFPKIGMDIAIQRWNKRKVSNKYHDINEFYPKD